ncbi:MAG: hypothetical protein ACK2U1_16525 [Anaerolineales bacterium]
MPTSYKIQPVYRICVQGRLSQTGAARFEGFKLTVDETISPLQTCLQGPVEDQAALHGLISRIRDLGLTLITVQRMGEKSTQLAAPIKNI